MITLFQFPRMTDGRNLSPFCLKVQAFLTLAQIEYQEKSASNLKAPKGKLPFISDDGAIVADSSQILAYLNKKYKDPLDHWLNEEQKALGHSICKMLEEHLYFAALWSRWIDPINWPIVKDKFFYTLPKVAKAIVPHLARRGLKKALYMQGMGRHSPEEIYAAGIQDIEALSWLLGDKDYILGDTLSSFDATVFAFTDNLLCPYFASPLKSFTESKANLLAYNNRLKKLTKLHY